MKEIAGLKVYSVKDIGELLNLTTPTVLTMIRDGRLPAAKLGRSYAITEEALRKYLNGETGEGNSRKRRGKAKEATGGNPLSPDEASGV